MQNDFPKELPSAADLDVVAEEQKVREATSVQPSEQAMADAAVLRTLLIDANTGPTPAQVDEILEAYNAAITATDDVVDEANKLKRAVILMVRLYGHPAAGSEHSRLLKGVLHKALLTDSTKMSLDETKVESLHTYLNGHERFDIFPRLFATRIKHELVAGAEQVLLTAAMPEHMRKRLKQMFAECIKVTDSAPRVKLDLLAKEPKQPRKRAAKKQAQQQAVQA